MRACTAQRPTKAVRQVMHEEAPQDDDDDDDDGGGGNQNAEYSLFNLNLTSNWPFQVIIIVDNQQVPMEIDTGAAVPFLYHARYSDILYDTLKCELADFNTWTKLFSTLNKH